ncbi:MAG TPA: hypothetical protein VK361_09200, partial [Rubrobacteraceae bacterium]|nr:hypothetical protein [Rubrobacteraceae bacterium]
MRHILLLMTVAAFMAATVAATAVPALAQAENIGVGGAVCDSVPDFFDYPTPLPTGSYLPVFRGGP